MKIKKFGCIEVTKREKSIYDVIPNRNLINLNWSALGSVNIKRAEEFLKDLKTAINYAKSL